MSTFENKIAAIVQARGGLVGPLQLWQVVDDTLEIWHSEQLGPRPTQEEIDAALPLQSSAIVDGEQWVIAQGFSADRKVILLNKLLTVKEAGVASSYPKLAALYGWMATVQGMAVAGQREFPDAPFSFEEVIAESAPA